MVVFRALHTSADGGDPRHLPASSSVYVTHMLAYRYRYRPQVLMAAEAKNPEYAFLFDLQSKEHTYYRWRLHSLAGARRAWKAIPPEGLILVD